MRARGIFHLLLAVVFAVGLVGCGGDDIRIEFEPDTAAGSPIELKFKPTQGMTYVILADIGMEMAVDADGEDVATEMDMGMEMAFEVTEVDEAGSSKLTITYKAIDMEMAIEAQGRNINMSFDSKTGRADPQQLRVLGDMIGMSIVLNLNPDGSTASVSGLDELMDAAGAQGQQSATSMSQTFEQMTMFFPDRPVDNGDEWTVTQEVESPAAMKMSMECVLLSHDATTATVGINGTLKMTGMPGNPNVSSVDVEGTMGGKAVVDRRTGFTTDLDLKMKLSGTVRAGGADAEMDITADMKYSAKK